MTNANGLVGNEKHDNSRYCFAKTNEVYLVYLPSGNTATLDLSKATGQFTVEWFDPRNGGALKKGSVTTVKGGAPAPLGMPPDNPERRLAGRRATELKMRLLKIVGWIGAGLVVLLLVAITATIGWRPFFGPSARALTDRQFTSTPARIDRGRYLAENVLNCFACHSDRDWAQHDAPLIAGTHGAGAPTFPLDGSSWRSLSAEHHARQGNWSRELDRRSARAGHSRGHRQRRPRAISLHAVRKLSLPVR